MSPSSRGTSPCIATRASTGECTQSTTSVTFSEPPRLVVLEHRNTCAEGEESRPAGIDRLENTKETRLHMYVNAKGSVDKCFSLFLHDFYFYFYFYTDTGASPFLFRLNLAGPTHARTTPFAPIRMKVCTYLCVPVYYLLTCTMQPNVHSKLVSQLMSAGFRPIASSIINNQ